MRRNCSKITRRKFTFTGGITPGVIQRGAFLTEYDVYTMSIKDILDELAEKSSYKWFYRF